MIWQLRYASGVKRALRALPANVQREIAEALDDLQYDPLPSGTLLLRGTSRDYRIKAVGKLYQIIYRLGTKSILIVRIEKRGAETYRGYNPQRKGAK